MGVTAAARGATGEPWLTVGDREFHSRLIVGIEQYAAADVIGAVLGASKADVFITTFDLHQTRASLLLSDVFDALPHRDFHWIGTTSFARSDEEAVKTSHMLRSMLNIDIIKLDVRDDTNSPAAGPTISAARRLLDDGFSILPLVEPKLEVAQELAEMGCCALRVLGSPVGSGQGILDSTSVEAIINGVDVPVIVEGGIGCPTHATDAMLLGATAVLVNAAIAKAADPAAMAAAMHHAVQAGILARSALAAVA